MTSTMKDLKIAYIANVRLPTEKAHSIQIMQMCEAFSKYAKELTLFAPKHLSGKNLKNEKRLFSFYSVKESFSIKKIFCIDLLFLDRWLEPFPFYCQNWSFAILAVFRVLGGRFDIVYSRSLIVACLLAFFVPKKVVYEAHDFSPNRLISRVYCFFLKRIRLVVVITEALKKRFREFGVDEKRICVAPDGVAEIFFQKIDKNEARRKLHLSEEKRIVLYTGNLMKWKGVYTLAEAAQLLDEDYLILFVGGDQKSHAEFQDFLKVNLVKNVELRAYSEYASIPCYLAAADCLSLPNSAKEEISRSYTSPLKLFEYMASGRPIVASDLPSIKEVLNENLALLVVPDDKKALAEGIRNIFSDNERAILKSKKAYEFAKDFRWSIRAQKIISHLYSC